MQNIYESIEQPIKQIKKENLSKRINLEAVRLKMGRKGEQIRTDKRQKWTNENSKTGFADERHKISTNRNNDNEDCKTEVG